MEIVINETDEIRLYSLTEYNERFGDNVWINKNNFNAIFNATPKKSYIKL